MRKLVLVAALAAVSVAASAGDARDNGVETRAYMNYGFGGHRALSNEMHLGLFLTQNAGVQTEGDAKLPAVMQLDFASTGVNTLRLNGVAFSSRSMQVQQAEGETAAAAEEGGFFSGIGDFFSNLFGGDDEEAAPVEEGAAEEGMFAGYTAGDWALLGVGVLGVGYLASESFGGDDSDPAGGGGGGETPPSGPNCSNPVTLILDPDCPLPLFTGKASGAVVSSGNYQEWMDAGTGQMGDLIAQ